MYGYGYIDRTYWDLDRNNLCDTDYVHLNNSADVGIISVVFPDIACELTALSYSVDSFLTINTSNTANPEQNPIQDTMTWIIEDGVVRVSTCQ